MSGRDIQLLTGGSSEIVNGKLFDELEPQDLLLVEQSWGPERDRIFREYLLHGVPRSSLPQSLHWRWDRKAPQLRLLEVKCAGIIAADSWQGVMLTKSASVVTRQLPDRGKPLVYIDYVETAPWNWRLPDINQAPRFRGIGVVLLRQAIEQSQDEGFHGRIALHALPQSESYYTKCGLTAVMRDPAKQNLLYFEMTQDAAERFLSKEG